MLSVSTNESSSQALSVQGPSANGPIRKTRTPRRDSPYTRPSSCAPPIGSNFVPQGLEPEEAEEYLVDQEIHNASRSPVKSNTEVVQSSSGEITTRG